MDPEMTPEQADIARQRAEIARERAEIAEAKLRAVAADSFDGDQVIQVPPPVSDAPEPETSDWQYAYMNHQGLHLEVRKPDESALVAISMTGVGGLGSEIQLRVFTRFLQYHMSERSFMEVLDAMTDPDSEITIQGLVTAFTQLS